jgi:hypothetical protein
VAAGYSLVELLFAMGLAATLGAMAVPQSLTMIDDQRAQAAARYLASRMQRARMEAVTRSTSVGIRFSQSGSRYTYAVYADGNGDGIRSADIAAGIDRQLLAPESLSDQFPGVDVGAMAALPAVEPGGTAPGTDPVRLGASNIASFSPQSTSTSGSVYIRGRSAQYVVRVYGDTAKTRVLRFDLRSRVWRPL